MSYSNWDAAYTLAQFQQKAGRPQENDPISNAIEYQYLSQAQNKVIADIAARYPQALWFKGDLAALTTTDQKVFTFGTDPSGYPVTPFGKVRIYPNASAEPDYPWAPGFDYLDEGTQIRIPNNLTWSAPLYWRGAIAPADITELTDPTLLPEAARELIVFEAVRQYGGDGVRNTELRDVMAAEYQRSFPRWMLLYQTQFVAGGALGPLVGSSYYGMGTTGYGSTSLAY